MRDLEGLFRARSVAIIGASDKNPWGAIAAKTLADIEYRGQVHLVNRRGTPALGRATIASCCDAGGGIDAAFVAVPAAHMIDAFEDMAAAGVKYGAVVTSGFGEVGEAGAKLQRTVFARAEKLGITLLGPNSLGFSNFVDGIALGAMPMPGPALPKPRVGLVSQSGATTVMIAQFAHGMNVPLSHMVAMGNEAMVDLADVLRFLVKDPSTQVIAVFAESIRNPAAFLEAAAEALAARKPIVMLKVGVGELTASVAQAHTGALVGDDKAFQAMCDAYNIVRVTSMEDLVITADLLATAGPVDPDKGLGFISISGGACELVADRGEEVGIPFPQFRAETLAKLSEVLADFGAAHNPLDITGQAMAVPSMFHDTLRILGESGDFAFIGVVGSEVPTSAETLTASSRANAIEIAKGFAQPGVNGRIVQQTLKQITPFGRQFIAEHGLPPTIGGLDHAVRALGHLWQWSRGLRRERPDLQTSRPTTVRPSGECDLLAWLGQQGVPVIPQQLVKSAEEAVAVAADFAAPAVLKILSLDIAHKTEVGGVMLNLEGTEAVSEGFAAIMRNVTAAKPEAAIEGVLVSPMRGCGQEMIVGVARDPEWGLVVAVGMGGVWVEVLNDSQLRLLPISEQQVVEALGQLKAAKLLAGYRGSKPADMNAVARAVVAICKAAMALGDDLVALEINPLRVDGDQVEALDALAVWQGD